MKENDLLSKLRHTSNKICIYGAGMVGSLVFSRLLAGNISQERIVFIVSQKDKKDMSFLGQTVYSIDELKFYPEYACAHIIIATLPDAHEEIIQTLRAYNYHDFDLLDSILFEEMEQAYVKKYNLEHPVIEGNKDVLFMSSDNNASSGAFLCMADINQELNKRGISTLVVLPVYGSGEMLLRERNIDFTYILSKDWLTKIDCIESKTLDKNENAVKEIQNLIKKHKIKLIHNNTTYTYVGAIAAQRENKPVIWHLREYIKEQGFWFIDENNAIQLINNSAAIIVVSDYIRKCYPDLRPSIVHKIYEGIDVKAYYNREHTPMKDPKIKILMPGMIIPLKGQKQLLEAALLLQEQGYSNFVIAFVGNGAPEYMRELKKYVRNHNLENNVAFYGRSNEMSKWYAWADVVIVCSKSESFGRVTVEAQLAGCLVIGARTGATVEIIEDKKTGFLYKYGNVTELASKIVQAMNIGNKVYEITRAGQDRAMKLFSKERNADELLEVYAKVLENL